MTDAGDGRNNMQTEAVYGGRIDLEMWFWLIAFLIFLSWAINHIRVIVK